MPLSPESDCELMSAPEPSTRSIWPRAVAVMVIIAGLVFAGRWVYGLMRTKWNIKSPTMTYAKSLERAIIAFVNEYEDRFPVPHGAGDTFADSSSENDLIRILCGQDAKANPRGNDFLGDTKQAKPHGKDGRLQGGLISGNGRWALVDDWGNPFRVLMDTDKNKELANPDVAHAGTKLRLRAKVIVWSAGEDGNFDTWDDNVKSWE